MTSIKSADFTKKNLDVPKIYPTLLNRNNDSNWTKTSDGPCAGDDDFMNDLLSKPMIDDDFEIPINNR